MIIDNLTLAALAIAIAVSLFLLGTTRSADR